MDGKQGFSLVILHFLFTSIYIACSDFHRKINGKHMEDAFADENLEEECYPSANSKWVFCRYRDDEKFNLQNLDPCFCSHILWLSGFNTSNIEKLKPLKSVNKDLKIIISIEIEQSDFRNSSYIKSKTAQWQSNYIFDGLDIRLGKITPLINKTVNDFVLLLEQLKIALGRKPLFLTIVKEHESFVSNVLLKTTHSVIDAISFHFHPQDLSDKKDKSQWLTDAITQMNILSNRTLMALSLLPSHETTLQKDVVAFKKCSTNLFEDDTQQKSNESSFEKSSEFVELLDYIENQTRELNKEDVAGIDLWVINEDDSNNLCQKGPFPLLEQISEVINPNQSPFEAFADLDIILSTSESEISDEIQVLHELNSQPEEIEQYGCERVGFFRHPTDCKKFYQCAEYRSSKNSKINQYAVFVYKCPRGLVYDELLGSCTWPSWSDPCPGSDELLPVPPKTFTCKMAGFHADPEDCRWFYYCSDLGDGQLEAFEFQCPSHVLGFDEVNMLCNWKWMVPTCGSSGGKDKSIDYDLPDHELKLTYNTQLTELHNANKVSNDGKNYSIATNIKTDNERNDLYKLIYQTPARSHQENINKTAIDHLYVKAHHSDSDINSTFTLANKIKRESEIREKVAPTLNKREPLSEAKAQISNEPQSQIEKKHGTAFWHRSFINKDSDRNYNGWTRVQRPHNNNLNARQVEIASQNSSLERIPSPLKINREVSEIVPNTGASQSQEKSGKGSVWRIIVEKEPISTRGFYHRSEIENLRNRNIHFHDTVKNVLTVNGVLPNSNKNSLPTNQNSSSSHRADPRVVLPQHHQVVDSKVSERTPFTNIRCLKLVNENGGREVGRYSEIHKNGDFGCVSEIALTVQMGNSKDADKYVLKDEQLNKSEEDSIDQSRGHQPIFSPWDEPADNTRRIGNLNRDLPNDTKFKQASGDQIHTSGRSISFEDKKIALNLPFSVPHFLNNTNTKEKLKKENEFVKGPIYPTEHFAAPLVSNRGKIEEESLVTQKNDDRKDETNSTDSTARERETSDSHTDADRAKDRNSSPSPTTNESSTEESKGEKMMPIHFYPQGVLINVDLSHLNEIPPLILIEVDRMLKTYMSSGDININLLKKRLNATTEGMKDPQHTTQENEMKDITNMIHLIGNMLSTSTEEPHSTAANNTDINDFSTTVRTEGNVHVKEIEYENVTEPNQDNKTDISHTTDSEEEIKKKKLANEKIVRNEQEELKAPFARRRLYRKYKYPSIREQIRKQNLHRYDLNNNHYFPTVIKAYNLPKVPAVSNRHRYPSIAEQLRRQMIEITSNERPSNLENLTIEDEPNTGRTELSDDKDLQFGDRIKIINPEISNQIHNHPNLPESQPDSNFGQLGNTANFPKIQAGKVFRTANENIDFDDEIDDNYQSSPARKPIINSIPQSQVPRSNLFYTLPILPSNNVHEPRANTYRGRYSAESSLPQEENVVRYRDNLSNFGRQQIQHNEQPAKRRRKLRILVKKRVDPNTLDNTDTTYPHSRHTERHLPPTRLPNNLLKVLKRKLKQRMNIDSENDVALQIQFQDYVWNVPFVNNQTDTAFSSTACTRPGLFQHPTDCNMFYECFWDRWLQKFTLHVFSCPVRLIYDDSVRGCSHPSIQSYCTDGARK